MIWRRHKSAVTSKEVELGEKENRDVESAGMYVKSKEDETKPLIKNNLVLPYTKELPNSYDIGTAYDRVERTAQRFHREDIRTIFEENKSPPWVKPSGLKEGPYLTYLKRLRYAYPSIGYLAEWMDVTTTPLKVAKLSQIDQIERAQRTKVAVIDYDNLGKSHVKKINDSDVLRDEFLGASKKSYDKVSTCVIIVEDLSREVIEILGSRFDIDPLFFRGQIADYKWYNPRDPWFEPPTLSTVLKSRPFHQVEYVQGHYFPNQRSKEEAEQELGRFNVLRRCDTDKMASRHLDEPGSDGGLTRSKLSLWIRPNKQEESGYLAILLVDPPLLKGHPIWGGYGEFTEVPKMSQVDAEWEARPRPIFDDMVTRLSNLNPDSLAHAQEDSLYILRLPLMRIASEWHLALNYANLRISQAGWELEKPEFFTEIEDSTETIIKKLSPWRRRLPHLKRMTGIIVATLTNRKLDDHSHKNWLADLNPDFVDIDSQFMELIRQTDKIISASIGTVSIEESRKAVEQNHNVTRLTYIALVFVPMSFVSSLFSMTPDLGDMKTTFWVYFVVSIPVTILSLLLAKSTMLLQPLWEAKHKKLKSS